MKKYIIFAGVNGAGKSTLYYSRPPEDIPRINTDEIVRLMGSWEDTNLQIKAGSMAVKKIKEYFQSGISFNQETTLCGHAIMNNIHKAKELGYVVEMHYVGISDTELAKERVAIRVKKGGHGIPDDVIEKRYDLSLDNLKKAIPLCDKVIVYDNTNNFMKIAEFKKGNLLWFNDSFKTSWFKFNVLDKLKCNSLIFPNESCENSARNSNLESSQPVKKVSLLETLTEKKAMVAERESMKQTQNNHKSDEHDR